MADDPDFARDYPFLWEYLNATQINESMDADPARLSVHIEESTWQATLTDNALRQSLSACGLTHRDALKALERALKSKDAQWVLWKKKGQEALREKKEPKNPLDISELAM